MHKLSSSKANAQSPGFHCGRSGRPTAHCWGKNIDCHKCEKRGHVDQPGRNKNRVLLSNRNNRITNRMLFDCINSIVSPPPQHALLLSDDYCAFQSLCKSSDGLEIQFLCF